MVEKREGFRIYRCIKKDGKESTQWFSGGGLWLDSQDEGYIYTTYTGATRELDRIRLRNKNPDVAYHAVEPA